MSVRSSITEAIRNDIIRGRWKPGEQLPGVAELCERFGVSTSTAVYAMHDLGALVDRRQGTGYFVNSVIADVRDDRPESVIHAHRALVSIRAELDKVINRLAA